MELNLLLLMNFFLLILSSVAIIEATTIFTDGISFPLNRSSFPDGFIFGTASSAYQVLQTFSIFLYLIVYLGTILQENSYIKRE